MGGEILVIFAFQILFGYIYFQIGLIVTVFLAGLMPGAWLGTRMTDRAVPVLRLADLALIMLMAGLALALSLPGAMLPVWFFLAFGFMVSLTCGFQFPLALHLEGGGQRAVRRFFAADLMGAAAGTLVTSTVLIPYAGLMGTLSALMFLKGTSLFLLGRRRAST
jgi:spermidine synthase